MNTSHTAATPPLTPGDKQNTSTVVSPPAPAQPLIKRMVAGLNRMQVDEAFREEIAKKIF